MQRFIAQFELCARLFWPVSPRLIRLVALLCQRAGWGNSRIRFQPFDYESDDFRNKFKAFLKQYDAIDKLAIEDRLAKVIDHLNDPRRDFNTVLYNAVRAAKGDRAESPTSVVEALVTPHSPVAKRSYADVVRSGPTR